MNDLTLTLTLPPEETSSVVDRPRPHLFLVLRSDDVYAPVARFCLSSTFEVRVGRGREFSGVHNAATSALTISLPDQLVSREHLMLTELAGEWRFEDRGTKNGTVINGVRRDSGRLVDGDVIQVGHSFFLYKVVESSQGSDRIIDADTPELVSGLMTLNPELEHRLLDLALIAGSSAAILVTGSTGTGKELIGRAAHALAERRGKFIPVNCGALSEKLVDAQLFGHIKGSFSGASDTREGLVAAADGGTLFLDEIGDLPLPAQAVLLRTLQEKEITPVGATSPQSVDFQLVSATHRDLVAMERSQTFRDDLIGRLTGFQMRMPDLSDRMEDLGLILRGLLERLCPERAPRVQFTMGAVAGLLQYAWPRNIRELENYLGPALALAKDGKVGLNHFPRELAQRAQPKPVADETALRTRLVTLLERHNGNVAAVAREMGKARAQIHRYARRFELDFEQFRKK